MVIFKERCLICRINFKSMFLKVPTAERFLRIEFFLQKDKSKGKEWK